MADKIKVPILLSPAQASELDLIAAAMERDRAWVIQRALSQYLRGEGADTLAEAESISQLAGGEGVEFDDVLRKAEAIIQRAEMRRAAKVG